MLSERGLSRSLGRCLGAFATLELALLGHPFVFVREPLTLVGGVLARVCQALALVRDAVPLVREVLAISGSLLSALLGGELPRGLRDLPALSLPLPLEPRVGALATLQLPLFRGPLVLPRQPLALVGGALARVRQPLAHVRQPLALVGDPLALVCQSLALLGGRPALFQAPGARLARPGQPLALQGEPLAFLGKLLAILGDVLALRGDSLALARGPNDLVQPLLRLLVVDRAPASFLGWISVRTHPGLISKNRKPNSADALAAGRPHRTAIRAAACRPAR